MTELRRTRKIIFPKILQRIAGGGTLRHKYQTQNSTHDNTACLSYIYDNDNYARLSDMEIGDLTNLLCSSHSGSPFVKRSLEPRALLASCVLRPCSSLARHSWSLGANPSGSMQWSLLPRGSLIAPNWCEARSVNRVSRVIYTFCVLARGIWLGRRVSFGRLGSPPGSQIRGKLAFRCRRSRSCLRFRSWTPTFPERIPRAPSWGLSQGRKVTTSALVFADVTMRL